MTNLNQNNDDFLLNEDKNKKNRIYSFAKKNHSQINSSILSIATAGLFLALIIALNFAFDAIPKFIGDFHIQMFLVVYALGIHLIKEKAISFTFMLALPPILFWLEPDAWNVAGLQIFLDYFIAFYGFGFCYLAAPLTRITATRFSQKTQKIIEIGWLVLFYSIGLTIKFFVHLAVGAIYFTDGDWFASLAVNGFWLANAVLTIPVLILVAPILITLNEKMLNNQNLKY